MLNPISLAFKKAKNEKRPALLTYTVAGDNTKSNSLKILNKDGLILIHDYYYSKNKVTNKIISYGPYFALKKILNENHDLELLPLKELVNFDNTSLVLIQNR